MTAPERQLSVQTNEATRVQKKSSKINECPERNAFKFNCSNPSPSNPAVPCGKGCCTHRYPRNPNVFMKRGACKEYKLGIRGQDLYDAYHVDKRSCKTCAPRCDHGKNNLVCVECWETKSGGVSMSVVEHLVKLRRPDTDVHNAMDVFGLDDDYKFKCNHERPSGIQRLFV